MKKITYETIFDRYIRSDQICNEETYKDTYVYDICMYISRGTIISWISKTYFSYATEGNENGTISFNVIWGLCLFKVLILTATALFPTSQKSLESKDWSSLKIIIWVHTYVYEYTLRPCNCRYTAFSFL